MNKPPFLGTKKIGLAVLVLAAYGAPAAAGDGDAFHPFVGLGYTHDDNLLRLPDGASLGGQRGDSMRQAVAGLLFARTYSLQDLYFQAKLTRVRFAHFDQLDYDGKDVVGRWKWQLGREWSGTLEGNYNQTLAPYTDFHSNERNLRTERRAFAEAMWRFDPSWRLRGALTQDKFSYDLALQKFNDRTEKLAEFGIDHLARSGNYAGLVLRRLKGEFPNKRVFGGTAIDEDFDQDELKARVSWRYSGLTQLDLLAGWAKRKHAFFTERDASGANGRVTLTYTPSGKTKLSGAAWREFAALESSVASYSLNQGASLAAAYEATGKTRLDASYSYEKRDYAARVNSPVARDFADSLRTASVGVNYAATRHVQLNLTAYRQSRGGSAALGLGSFKAKGVSFSANLQF